MIKKTEILSLAIRASDIDLGPLCNEIAKQPNVRLGIEYLAAALRDHGALLVSVSVEMAARGTVDAPDCTVTTGWVKDG